jgi:hypothetical protein
LKAQQRNLPRLDTGKSTGGVDLRLESRDGRHVRAAASCCSIAMGGITSSQSTRAHGDSASAGYPPANIRSRPPQPQPAAVLPSWTIRKGDVARASLALNRPVPSGPRASASRCGSRRKQIPMRVTDRNTGKVVFEGDATVTKGVATLSSPGPAGTIDVLEPKSCYDADADDPSILQFHPPLELDSRPIPESRTHPSGSSCPRELQG